MGIRSELHLVHKGVDTVEMPSGSEIMQQTEKLVGRCLGKKYQDLYNKRKRGEDACVWKKRGILFTLPYWADQKLRHNINVMHTENNVTNNIMARQRTPTRHALT